MEAEGEVVEGAAAAGERVVAVPAAVQLLGGVKLPKEMWLKVLSFLRPSDFFSLDRVPLAATPTADELQAPDAAALVPAGV